MCSETRVTQDGRTMTCCMTGECPNGMHYFQFDPNQLVFSWYESKALENV